MFSLETHAEPHEVAVFLVRHGQRIDETAAGRAWQAANADRWFDPPLTDEGRRQAGDAAEQLKSFIRGKGAAIFAPFSRVYTSPLLRTLQTAEQFGAVLQLPVTPAPGIATCTAAFKRHGARGCPLLGTARARAACAGIAHVEEFDPAYDGTAELGTDGGCDGAGCDSFVGTVARLARREGAAFAAAQQAAATTSASGSSGGAGGGERQRIPSVLVVTHREGLRDLSQLTGNPFVKTKYCCIGLFGYFSYGEGGGGSGTGGSRAAIWSLRHSPEDFEPLLRDALLEGAGSGGSIAGDAPMREVVDAYAESEENTKAPRRIAHDGRAYTRVQFEKYYGGTAEWDVAAPAQAV